MRGVVDLETYFRFWRCDRCGLWSRCLRADRIAEGLASVGTVREDVARIVGERIGPGLAVFDVGWCDSHHRLDQGGLSIGSDMGLDPMNGRLALMFDPVSLSAILCLD